MNKLEVVLDEHIQNFLALIEQEYHITTGELWKKWKSSSNGVAAIKKVEVKKEKKSNYQIFFSQQRVKMMNNNPSITFGEISQKVSAMWKAMTPEQKASVGEIQPKTLQSLITTTTTPPKIETPENDYKDELKKLTINDLKDICRKNKITTNLRKKDDMILALVEYKQQETQIPPAITFKPDTTKGRSKLEISAEDKDDVVDEDDFFFNDEDDTSLPNSDYEDDDVLVSDEDDIFCDDD